MLPTARSRQAHVPPGPAASFVDLLLLDAGGAADARRPDRAVALHPQPAPAVYRADERDEGAAGGPRAEIGRHGRRCGASRGRNRGDDHDDGHQRCSSEHPSSVPDRRPALQGTFVPTTRAGRSARAATARLAMRRSATNSNAQSAACALRPELRGRVMASSLRERSSKSTPPSV